MSYRERNLETRIRNLITITERIKEGQKPEISDEKFEAIWAAVEEFCDLNPASQLRKKYGIDLVLSDYRRICDYRSPFSPTPSPSTH